MLRRLYLDNFFKHQDRTFLFEGGLTGIIGPNESGKSLIVEGIRYALFGTRALRGAAEDYKKLHVELDFEIAGASYTVIRKGIKTELVGIASGAKPVNDAIQRILGYDLAVFDVANVCNQGDVERLSNMRPAERKLMVDQTVGLNVLDDVIKFCGDEGNALKREAAGFERALIEPVAPAVPEGYLEGHTFEEDLKTAQLEATEYQQLKGFLAHSPEKPQKPKACPVKTPLAALKEAQSERENLQQSITNTQKKINDIPVVTITAAELDAAEEALDLYSRWQSKARLLSQGEHICPACAHSWPVADLGDLEEVEEAPAPLLSASQIRDKRTQLGNQEIREGYLTRIEAFKVSLADLPDVSEDIKLRRDYEALLATYESQLAAYQAYTLGLEQKQARFESLEGSPERAATLATQLTEARAYERANTAYKTAQGHYEKNLAAYEAMINRSNAFLSSRQAVQDLKVQIKTHLLPSLNKVASYLLSQMTGGERYKVEVDADFEILIDDQTIATLSGSGKAVANLAVRLALGQILTNRVFSVFLADEIDAAMDDERAAYTAQALQRLTKTVGQVIQVTHKSPETDHTIELKK